VNGEGLRPAAKERTSCAKRKGLRGGGKILSCLGKPLLWKKKEEGRDNFSRSTNLSLNYTI